MSRIFVAGYPKSGNTWLARLLGEVYQAPVDRWRAALPLCVEGFDRESDVVIHQLHLRPIADDADPSTEAIPNAYTWDWRIPLDPGDRIVYIMRDVRDVIVSAYFYWQRETLLDAVEAVTQGNHPLSVHGPWPTAVSNWLNLRPCVDYIFPVIKYENLVRDPVSSLESLLTQIGIAAPEGTYSESRIRAAVDAQSFENTVKRIQSDGDDRPYGKEIQLRNLRKGVAGDWRNHFTSALGCAVEYTCGPVLAWLGYENDPEWWRKL